MSYRLPAHALAIIAALVPLTPFAQGSAPMQGMQGMQHGAKPVPSAPPAQPSATAAPTPPQAASSAPATATSLGYRSAFEGYQAYTDESVKPWKESNDTVGKVGGWRAYAKEARGTSGSPASAAPPSGAPAATSGQSKPGADPHAGHGKP